VAAELLAGLHLSAQLGDEVGRHVARAGAALDHPHDAGVRTVARLLSVGARATGLVAPQVTDGERAAAHRPGLGQHASEVANGGGDLSRVGHRAFLLANSILERSPRRNLELDGSSLS
jgi:hypothetical protein